MPWDISSLISIRIHTVSSIFALYLLIPGHLIPFLSSWVCLRVSTLFSQQLFANLRWYFLLATGWHGKKVYIFVCKLPFIWIYHLTWHNALFFQQLGDSTNVVLCKSFAFWYPYDCPKLVAIIIFIITYHFFLLLFAPALFYSKLAMHLMTVCVRATVPPRFFLSIIILFTLRLNKNSIKSHMNILFHIYYHFSCFFFHSLSCVFFISWHELYPWKLVYILNGLVFVAYATVRIGIYGWAKKYI